MTAPFEGSFSAATNVDDVLECGVCWWVYDPAEGDTVWDIQPGTAFADLPDHWRCPKCDALPSKFMIIADGATKRELAPVQMDERVAGLIAAYRRAEDAIIGMPVHNPKLTIEAIGFQSFGQHYIGIITTPWAMNIVIFPADPEASGSDIMGSNVTHVFPAGAFDFIAGRMDGFGYLETCSLFSPMEDFASQEAAHDAAVAAMEALFTVEEPEKPAPVSRRALFVGAD